MDQFKTGNFIKELRKEKNLTQEKIAEVFNVSRRTVSRWETGSNMPDLDILIEMSDYYDVDIREIFDGERKDVKMNEEMKDTILKVAEYSNEEKIKMSRMILIYLVIAAVMLAVNIVLRFLELPSTFWTGFLEGATSGFPFFTLILCILYLTGNLNKVRNFKLRLIGRK